MKTVFINTSPKKHYKLSNSAYIGLLTRFGCGRADVLYLRGKKDYDAICSECEIADNVIFTMPIYVDSIPAHVLTFLQEIKEKAKSWHCKVYVVTCCGFYEGHQTSILCRQIELWCEKTGLTYGGGIGVGGTEMLGAIRFTNLFGCIPTGLLTGIITYLFSGNLHSSIISGVTSFICPLTLYLLWSSGLFINAYKFGRGIKKGKIMENKFTTLWFCPRFLFTAFASIYWVLRALKNKVLIHKIFKKIEF